MIVEPALAGDCRAIAEIHTLAWQVAYAGIVSDSYLSALSVEQRESSWLERLRDGGSRVLVARTGAGMAGFISFGPSRDDGATMGCGEVMALYVSPKHESIGVGRALWLAALGELRAQGSTMATVCVLALNVRGLGFYRAMGFVPESGSERMVLVGQQELAEVRLILEVP